MRTLDLTEKQNAATSQSAVGIVVFAIVFIAGLLAVSRQDRDL